MRRNEAGGKTRQSVQKAKKRAGRPDPGKGRPGASGGKTRANAAPPPIPTRPGRLVDTGRRAGPRLAPTGETRLPALHGQNPGVSPDAQLALRRAFNIYEHPLPRDPAQRRAALMLAQQYKMRTGRNLRQQRNMREALREAGLTDFGIFAPEAYEQERAAVGAGGVEQLTRRPFRSPDVAGLERMTNPTPGLWAGLRRNLGVPGLQGLVQPSNVRAAVTDRETPQRRGLFPLRGRIDQKRGGELVDALGSLPGAAKDAAIDFALLGGPGLAPMSLGLLGLGKASEAAAERALPPLQRGLSRLAPQVDTAQALTWAGNDPDKQRLVNIAAAGEDTEQGITQQERVYLEGLAKERSGVSDSDLRMAGVGQLLRWAYPAPRSFIGGAANFVNDAATTFVGAPAGAAGAVRALGSSFRQGSAAPLIRYGSDTLVEPFVELADDPAQFAYENPFSTALMAGGGLRALGAVGGRARPVQARRPVVLDKLPERAKAGEPPITIPRPGVEPRNLVDLAATRLADSLRQRSARLQQRYAQKDASALGARTRTAAQNAAAANTAEARRLRQQLTPLEQVRYDWADSKGLTPQDWIGFYERELAKVAERLENAQRTATTAKDARKRQRWEAHAVKLENQARDLNEQINGWRAIDRNTKPIPEDLKAQLDAAHRAIDERNRPILEQAGLPPENIEARRFAETRLVRGDLPADDIATLDQLRAEGVSPFYTRNAPATRTADAFRGIRSPIPHTDVATAAVPPGSLKRWTGATIRQGRLNVDPEQTLRALERPAYAERWLAGTNEAFDRYSRPARPGMAYDQSREALIDRNRLRQLQKEARADDGGVWDQLLDDADQTGQSTWTTIGEKATGGRVPADGGDYALVPRSILNQLRGQLMPQRMGRVPTLLGQATDAWRLGFMHARPGYHTANVGTSGLQAVVGGVGPRDVIRAIRLRRHDVMPRSISTGTFSDFYGPRVRDLPTRAGEYTGRGGLRRPFTNERGELGGPLGTLLKPVRSWSELWRNAADSLERLLHEAAYLKRAAPEAQRRAEEWGTDLITELKKIAREEDIRPDHAERVKDVFGDFTKRRNEAIALGAPFYRFYNAILRQTFHTMPLKHPNRALILNLLGDQGEEELERLGLPLFPGMVGAVPVLTGGRGIPDWVRGIDLRAVSQFAVPTEILAGPEGQMKNPLAIAGGIANPVLTDMVEPWLGGTLRGEPRAFRDEKGQRYGLIGALTTGGDPNLPATLRTIAQRVSRYPLGAAGQIITDRTGKADTSIDIISEQPRRESADPEYREKRRNDLLIRGLGAFGIRILDKDLNDPAYRRRVMLAWKDAAEAAGQEVPPWVKDELKRMSVRTDAEREIERAKEKAKRLERSAAPGWVRAGKNRYAATIPLGGGVG